jgi:hypothetical protein
MNEYNYFKDIMIANSECPPDADYNDIRFQIKQYLKNPKKFSCDCQNLIMISDYFDICFCRRCELYFVIVARKGEDCIIEPCLIQWRDDGSTIKYQWFPSMTTLPTSNHSVDSKKFSKMFKSYNNEKKKRI